MRRRPGSVTTIAILQIVFGSLLLLCGLIGMGGQALQGAMPGNADALRMQQDLENRIPGYRAFQIGDLILTLVFAGIMIASGILMLKLRPGGRSLALFYAIARMVLTIVSMVYTFGFVLPGMSNFFANAIQFRGQPQLRGVMETTMYTTAAITVLISFIYPIIVLVILTRPNVKAAFAPGGSDFEDERPFDRDEYDVPRRSERDNPPDDRYRGGEERYR